MFDRIREQLDERAKQHRLRSVQQPVVGIDFCSNDYLGFGAEPLHLPPLPSGSGASRLISGYSDGLAQLEQTLAQTYWGETATFFSSGYEANAGVVHMLHSMGIRLLYDAHIHASMRSALHGGSLAAWKYKHLDMADLEAKLKRSNEPVVVLTEGLFSMDGDQGKLADFAALKAKYNFVLVVDEAHSTGTIGEGLLGWSGASGDLADVRIHTFGKALGIQGAVVVASRLFQQAMHNFCRPLIYSTAPSPLLIEGVRLAHERFLQQGATRRLALNSAINTYLTAQKNSAPFSAQPGPIQWFGVAKGALQLKEQVSQLRKTGFAVYGIQAPTVPEGTERIRICLHSFNTPLEIDQLCAHLK
jgi:8-amino-7-oxononanoate synthase